MLELLKIRKREKVSKAIAVHFVSVGSYHNATRYGRLAINFPADLHLIQIEVNPESITNETRFNCSPYRACDNFYSAYSQKG